MKYPFQIFEDYNYIIKYSKIKLIMKERVKSCPYSVKDNALLT